MYAAKMPAFLKVLKRDGRILKCYNLRFDSQIWFWISMGEEGRKIYRLNKWKLFKSHLIWHTCSSIQILEFLEENITESVGRDKLGGWD